MTEDHVPEESRGGVTWIDRAGRDVRHACRMIMRMPGLAAVVIVSLGVGIGVNTTIFSWIQAMVFQPLPGVTDGASFHFVEPRAAAGSYPGASWLEYNDLRERLHSFRDLLAFRMVPFNLGEAARTERSYGLLVSGNYFSALDLRPALGRFVRPEEVVRAGGESVVVISNEFWHSRFGGSPGALGQTLRVNDHELTVVGVTPPGFQGTVLGLNFDLWVPATLAPVLLGESTELEDRGQRGYAVMGRLQPSASRAQAQAEVDASMQALAQAYPETNRELHGRCFPSGKRRGVRSVCWCAGLQSCRPSCCSCCLRSVGTQRAWFWRGPALGTGKSACASRSAQVPGVWSACC